MITIGLGMVTIERLEVGDVPEEGLWVAQDGCDVG
jgi:hypothetical protein